LLDCNLWPHFANTAVLQAFCALRESDRRKLWGDFIDPNDALADFDPRYVSDDQLRRDGAASSASCAPSQPAERLIQFWSPS
jgi:hypothetical protein